MRLASTVVGMLQCTSYSRQQLKEKIDTIFQSISFSVSAGSKVLLKPNLISAGNNGLGCTHPEIIAATAEWLLDWGAQVTIGDSPAFGSAKKVMQACGVLEALQDLPVRLVNFNHPRKIDLAGGFRVGVESEVLECDVLVNLPKCKAHSQFLLTLAVKNYFGAVVGLRKPFIHARYGDVGNKFEELIVDLLDTMPEGVSLIDGVVAMHRTGPVKGEPCRVGAVAASKNPVALDSALMALLGCDPADVPLWRECKKRNLQGVGAASLEFPLMKPEEIQTESFILPPVLIPITFHPGRLALSSIRRMAAHIR